MPVRVYLAGPGVFCSDADELANELRDLCARHGLQGLWPAEGDHDVTTTARGI